MKLYTLPKLRGMLADKRHTAVGTLGEMTAARLLEQVGYNVSFTHHEKRGDLRVVCNQTGQIWRVEVKTARRGKDKKWRFTLVKDGCTDHRDSDVVILLAVRAGGDVVPFVIPTADISARRHIVITSDPNHYRGAFAKYRREQLCLTS